MSNKTITVITLVVFLLYTGMLITVINHYSYKNGYAEGMSKGVDTCTYLSNKADMRFYKFRKEANARIDSTLKANRKFYNWYYKQKQYEN